MATVIAQVEAVLDGQLRTLEELANRCALPTPIVASSLRELRRRGEVEFVKSNQDFRWRLVLRLDMGGPEEAANDRRDAAAERDRAADERDRAADQGNHEDHEHDKREGMSDE